MKNSTKAWAFLGLISVILILVGHALLEREGLLFGLMLALGINSYIYFYESRRLLRQFNGRRLEGRDPWGLLESARDLAEKAKVSAPEILIISDPSPQSFVVGQTLTSGTILITQGLLEKLTPQEVRALLALQIAHIKNLNTLIFSIGSFVCSFLLFFSEALDTGLRFLIVEKKNPNYALSHIFTIIISPLAGALLRLCVRPQIYYTADKIAASWLENPKVLADAFWKLQSYSATLPYSAPLFTSHMFVLNPLTRSNWLRHFDCQPPTSERIKSLIGYYPI